MLSFKNFMEDEVADEPVPPNVRPEDWANPSWRKFWKMQNPNYKAAPNLAQTTTPTAAQQQKPYPQQQQQRVAPYQDMASVENAIRTYLSRLPGMPATGTLKNLPDLDLIGKINAKIRSGEIPLQQSSIRAMEAGRGVHFYKDKTGNVAFVVNRH